MRRLLVRAMMTNKLMYLELNIIMERIICVHGCVKEWDREVFGAKGGVELKFPARNKIWVPL